MTEKDRQRSPRHRIVVSDERKGPDGRVEEQNAKLVCDGSPSDWCHVYPDCKEEASCMSDDPDCEHPETEHANCVVVEWTDFIGDLRDSYDGPDLPSLDVDYSWSLPRYHDGPVTVSTHWNDEGPTWQYDQAVLPDQVTV